jgi:hypothetical protein
MVTIERCGSRAGVHDRCTSNSSLARARRSRTDRVERRIVPDELLDPRRSDVDIKHRF